MADKLDDGNPANDGAACNKLLSVRNQVSAKSKTGQLSASQAFEIYIDVISVYVAVSC